MKVYIAHSSHAYVEMFTQRGFEVVNSVEEADFVQFTGGADVSPGLYGEEPHPQTFSDWWRDSDDLTVYDKALDRKLPMAGICRGAQFLHVMSGGKLWQHVDGHAVPQGHMTKCQMTGREIPVTSTHHQMLRLTGSERLLLEGVRTHHTYKEDALERHTDVITEVEAVLHGENILCYQPHPEMCRINSECQELYFYYLKELLGVCCG